MKKLLMLVVFAGCSPEQPANNWVKGFTPPALLSGYQRLISPTIKNITPGTDAEWCQWVLAASDKDRDIIDLGGAQSATGHHGVLYATTDTSYAVGESHLCTEDDMLQISFLGAVGGEGVAGSAARLPDGLYFRLPAGKALMANTHWVNATTQPVDGQAVFDVKFAEPDPQRQIADLFANNGATFVLPPGQTTSYEVTCTLQTDLTLVMSANHMHENGLSAFSELIRGDGTKLMLVQDDTWAGDQQFNPKYVRFGLENAVLAKKGDVYRTRCQWDNQTGQTLGFPTEMCTGVSFYYPSQGQIACADGNWP